MRTPKKLASSMKAVKVSYIRSGPWIGPDILDGTLQLVPNWNAMTIPDTTPSPNHTEYLQPKFEEHTVDRLAGSKTKRFEDGQPGCETDREGWKDHMKRYGEGELKSRQEKRRHIHSNSPGPGPSQ
jgi:hypothetical protein